MSKLYFKLRNTNNIRILLVLISGTRLLSLSLPSVSFRLYCSPHRLFQYLYIRPMDPTQKFELESHLSSGINPEPPSLGHTPATMIHLPYEIWDIIIHNVVSEYTDTTLGGNALKSTVLLPRWYLVPLLRVCKACCPLAEKYLYQSISIGSKFPHRISHIEGEPVDERLPCVQESSKPIVNRNEREIAEDLLATLERNARLAGLVEELNLGMETWEVIKSPECTIRILCART